MEDVLGGRADSIRFQAFLDNWEAILARRVEEALAAFGSVEGLHGLVLAGSVGRGEPWPLSDLDLLPIYADDALDSAPAEIDRRRRILLARWIAEGWWTGLDIGRLRFTQSEVGVVITDSALRPLLWGVSGMALGHSGVAALKDYVGHPDVFGRPLAVTKASVRDALAGAAVLVMGEADEQTPLAIIDDVPFVAFQGRDPTDEELAGLRIAIEDDLYAPPLTRAPWQKGKQTPPRQP